MLHVNLIQERLRARELRSFVARLGGIGLLALCVVIVALLSLQLVQGIKVKKEKAQVEEQIKEFRPDAERCSSIQKEIGKLLPLWDLTDEVVESQQMWSLVLKGISDALPPRGGVSVQSMNATTSGAEGETVTKIALLGTAPDEFAVANYIKRLNSLAIFEREGTNLSNVAVAEQEEREVRRFNLELELAGKEAKPTP